MLYNRSLRLIIPFIISIIFAIIVGVLFTTAIVTGFITLLYSLIALTGVFLIILIIVSLLRGKKENICISLYGPGLLLGSLGTIVTSIITISLTIGATGLAILAAIITFFTVLSLIEFFLLLLCIIKSNCKFNE